MEARGATSRDRCPQWWDLHLDGSGTRLRLTEQLAYLNGHYDLGECIRGTGEGPQPTRTWRLVLEAVENLQPIKH
jgi:hypothetical protein